jgi:hypothetical protein
MPAASSVNRKRGGTSDLLVFAALLAPVFAWSAWVPKDTLTWWLEVAPVLIGFAASWVVRRRFALSLLLLVAAVGAVILARRRSGLDSTGRGVAPAALNVVRSGRQPI